MIAAPVGRRIVAGLLDDLAIVAVALGVRRARRLTPAVDAAYRVGLTARFGQTPGEWLMGVRVVDVAAGARPRWNQVAVRWGVTAIPNYATSVLRRQGAQGDLDALRPELDRIASEHSDDYPARYAAQAALLERVNVRPFSGCLPHVVVAAIEVADLLLAALDTPWHRRVADRVAGTVVVTSDNSVKRGRLLGARRQSAPSS